MPGPRLLDPVSLFLTDERSDAAVVGSGNKAMRILRLGQFEACRTWGSIIIINNSNNNNNNNNNNNKELMRHGEVDEAG